MTAVRQRSPSPSAPAKKIKVDEAARVERVAKEDINLPPGAALDSLADKYGKSTPYKHVVVSDLISDALVSGSLSHVALDGAQS